MQDVSPRKPMPPDVQSFVCQLRALNPAENDDHLEGKLYELVDSIEHLDASGAIPDIFVFFEAYPEADHGTPGPLVHLVERYLGKYEEELKASMRRRPTPHTVWMTNRILNTQMGDYQRREWMEFLESALDHPRSTEGARDYAESFIEHQRSKED